MFRGLAGTPGIQGCAVCLDGKLSASDLEDQQGFVSCLANSDEPKPWKDCKSGCPRIDQGNLVRLPLATARQHYGALLIAVDDRESFEFYEPYLAGIASLAALNIENRRQAGQLRSLAASLEEKVRLRTDQLRAANQSLRFAQYATDHIGEEAFWIVESGQIVYANEAASRNLGYTREEMLDLRVTDFDPLHSEQDWIDQWVRLRTDKFVMLESIHRAKSGREYPVEITASHVAFDGEEFICAVGRLPQEYFSAWW